MAIDPACGVEVDPTDPGASTTHEGATYVFCSEGCKEHFEANPDQYVDSAADSVELGQIGGVRTQRLSTSGENGQFELSVSEPGELTPGDEVTYKREITEEHVHQFAELTGDSNALHLNDTFAEQTRFGQRIVHGALVSGLISAALAALPGMTVFLSQNLEFKRPIEVGDTVAATCKVVETIEDDRFCLTVRVRDPEDKVAIYGTSTVLIDELPAV